MLFQLWKNLRVSFYDFNDAPRNMTFLFIVVLTRINCLAFYVMEIIRRYSSYTFQETCDCRSSLWRSSDDPTEPNAGTIEGRYVYCGFPNDRHR